LTLTEILQVRTDNAQCKFSRKDGEMAYLNPSRFFEKKQTIAKTSMKKPHECAVFCMEITPSY